MTKDEALDLALEALELSAVTVDSFGVQKKTQEAITAIKQALAEPVQEPVAWCTKSDLENMAKGFSQDVPARSMRVPQLYPKEGAVLLYTTPPAAPVQLVQPVAWMHTSGHIQIFHPHWEQVAVDGYTREKGWTPLYTTPPAQPSPVQPVAFEVGLVEWVGNKLMATPKTTTTPPASWVEMVTANLVRQGIGKHKARELAEHFYSLKEKP